MASRKVVLCHHSGANLKHLDTREPNTSRVNSSMIDENTKAFFTLAWGFDPYEFPAWGFSTRGAANSAGDWLVVVATGGEPTEERDRGRVLGMLQVSSGSQIHDLDMIIKNLDGPKDPKIFDDDGVFKWRHGFLITKAVRFDDPPIFNELFPSYERNGRQIITSR